MVRYLGEATGFLREHQGRLCLHDEKTDFRLYLSIESVDLIDGIGSYERVRLTFEPLHMRVARVKPLQIERLPEEYRPISFTSTFFSESLEGADRLDGPSLLTGVFSKGEDELLSIEVGSVFEAYLYSALYDDSSRSSADVIVGSFMIRDDWHYDLMYCLKDIQYSFSSDEWSEFQNKTVFALPFVAADSEHLTVKRKSISSRLRYEVLLRDGHKCVDCGASPAQDPSIRLEIDHRIPVSKGGTNDIENLQTLCWACNNGKSDSVDHKLIDSLQQDSSSIAI